MELTREQLLADRDSVQRQHNKAIADVHATDGALQYIDNLLAQLNATQPVADVSSESAE